ncbi:MAG: mechanosensitive ion channel family protein [Bacteroidetes bacterium]|nr:MAG: mechanosensitive ion channel family protein [Bacteroidota bacterium]
MENIDKYIDIVKTMLVEYGPKVIGAILVLFVGLKIISTITKTATKLMTNKKIDASLAPFLSSLLNMTLKALLVISVMSMVGIEMTSFIAILGAAGLAIGMALSGTMQNFAGGVMILIFKPYKVGDFIEAEGQMGVVKEIQIFNTIITTVDNKRIIIPNGGLSNSTMTNFTAEPTRRVDFTFGIGYGDDIDKAREVMFGEIAKFKQVLSTPAKPFIGVSELGDSSVNFAVRVWVKTEDYWDVFFGLNENVKKAFDANNISIPFPQTDVHIFQETK